jgi:hypothetical protein
MFEPHIRAAFATGNEITIVTLFGIARGLVKGCEEGWFTFVISANSSKVNVYYEDVMLLEEHRSTEQT